MVDVQRDGSSTTTSPTDEAVDATIAQGGAASDPIAEGEKEKKAVEEPTDGK